MSTQEELLREAIAQLSATTDALRESSEAQIRAMAAQQTDPAVQANLERIANSLDGGGAARESRLFRNNMAEGARYGRDASGFIGTFWNSLREGREDLRQLEDMMSPRSDLLAMTNRIQERFGGIAGRQGANFREGITFGSRYSEMLLEMDRQLRGAESTVDGLGISLSDLFGGGPASLQVASKAFRELIEDSQASADGLITMRTASKSLGLEMAMFGTRMELTSDQTATFISRSIDLYGEANADLLRDSAVYAQRLAAATGDSGKEILTIMEQIVSSSENFGNVMPEEAAKIASSLRQLGIDFKEFEGMQRQFLNFDSAVQNVSALTSVFGVNIDAMEMMQLANEDQYTFLMRMREAFIDTGRSVDDYSQAELRLIKSRLGLQSESAVRRLLDPDADIQTMADLDEAAGDAVEGTDAALVELQDQVARFGRVTAGSLEDYANELNYTVETQTQRALLDGASQYQEFYSQVLGMHQAAVTEMGEASGIPDAAEMAAANYLPGFIQNIYDGISAATELIEAEVIEMFERIDTWMRENFPGYGHSPSEWGLSMLHGITDAMGQMPGIVESDFGNLNEIAAENFEAIVKYGQSASAQLAREVSQGIGAAGLEYSRLTDEQRNYYIEAWGLGAADDPDSQSRLQSMMGAFADERMISLRRESDEIMLSLQTLSGRENIEDEIRTIAELNSVDEDVIRQALSGNRNAVFEALRAKEARDAEVDEESSSTEERITEEQSRTTAAVEEIVENTDTLEALNNQIVENLSLIRGEIAGVSSRIDNLSSRPISVLLPEITIDGRVVAQSVTFHASGDSPPQEGGQVLATRII